MVGTHVDRVTVSVRHAWSYNAELTDKADILHKRCTFIGQVNNILCCFPRLDDDVRRKFFRSCYSSILVVNCVV